MNRQKIRKAYEDVRPGDDARKHMLQAILLEASEISPAGKDDMMKHRKMNPLVLVALIALLTAMAVTAFASEEISGWFKQYFARNAENGLTPGQIEYLNENERIFDEIQTHNGYDLKMKSVLSDPSAVYVTVGITAPPDVTAEDLRSLRGGSDIDFYDENRKPCASWRMDVIDDLDGLENTADLVFEMNPADWNSGNLWTLRIDCLGKLLYNEEYAQELRKTKYAGQQNFMFTDEEAAKINSQSMLAEGPWEFVIDLSKVEKEVVELLSEPITVQTRYGYREDGTYLFQEVRVLSVEVSPLSATIQSDTDYAPDFTSGDRKIYAVMDDGSRIALLSNWGVGGKQHFNAEFPIILEEMDYILFADGTRIMAP